MINQMAAMSCYSWIVILLKLVCAVSNDAQSKTFDLFSSCQKNNLKSDQHTAEPNSKVENEKKRQGSKDKLTDGSAMPIEFQPMNFNCFLASDLKFMH